jgi:hypothetical protein
MQQEYLEKPRLLAISEIDRALDNCRKVLDHSRRKALPVAFIRMLNESAFFNKGHISERHFCQSSTGGYVGRRNPRPFQKFLACTEMYMKRPIGSPQLHLKSSEKRWWLIWTNDCIRFLQSSRSAGLL